MRLKNKEEQVWYLTESKKSNWSVRQLQRAISTKTYNRVISNQSIEPIRELTSFEDERPENNIKSPYIFDFLGISNKTRFSEHELEDTLLNHYQNFYWSYVKDFPYIQDNIESWATIELITVT